MRKHITKLLTALLAIVMLLPVTAQAAPTDGWTDEAEQAYQTVTQLVIQRVTESKDYLATATQEENAKAVYALWTSGATVPSGFYDEYLQALADWLDLAVKRGKTAYIPGVIRTVAAMGLDVTDFAGHDLMDALRKPELVEADEDRLDMLLDLDAAGDAGKKDEFSALREQLLTEALARQQSSRYLLIFAATAGIILTRRWYLYFVVGYCFAYVLLLAVSSIRLAKDGQPSRAVHRMVRLVVFGLCAAGAMVLLLLPMVRKILSFDYAGRYSYYNFGGITLELAAQTLRIGLLNFILIGMGLWFAAKRRLPALPCLAGAELLVSLVLFTRVQNTGSHQMLLFVPGWLLLFLVGSAALADGLKKHTAVKLCYWGFTMVFAVSVRCSPLTTVALPGFVVDHFPLKAVSEFVRLDKLTYDRTDAAQIQRVDDWIDAHCDAEKGEFAYMIPHDMLYNSDIFQYAALPDIQLQGKLAAGISIPGTHEFPVRFFEAKYVLTAEPFPQTFVSGGELSGRWNALFCAARDEHFTQAASFDMGNGTVFTVWERTEPADRAEVEYYLDAFAQEDALYPEMFSQVAEAWLAGHGL